MNLECLKPGQWIGSGFGDNTFNSVILELDESDGGLAGSVYAFDTNHRLPSVFASLRLSNTKRVQDVVIDLQALDPKSQAIIPFERVTEIWPQSAISPQAKIRLSFVDEEIHAQWRSDFGLSGECTLWRAETIDADEVKRNQRPISWKEFQEEVSNTAFEEQVFRGQSGDWPLRSSFHRTDANDLISYFEKCLPSVRRQLTPFLKGSSFDGDEGELALLHLLQHYGYPTPLIDWSYSPFIAAFFSYAPRESNGRYVFTFDKKGWEKHHKPKTRVGFCEPHLSLVEALPILNERSLPQQGLSMMTNIASVEAYILAREEKYQEQYLSMVQLRDEDRRQALTDLSLMGISPASVYPGLEGACQAMKAKHFGY